LELPKGLHVPFEWTDHWAGPELRLYGQITWIMEHGHRSHSRIVTLQSAILAKGCMTEEDIIHIPS